MEPIVPAAWLASRDWAERGQSTAEPLCVVSATDESAEPSDSGSSVRLSGQALVWSAELHACLRCRTVR
jgi:hypothetical protein